MPLHTCPGSGHTGHSAQRNNKRERQVLHSSKTPPRSKLRPKSLTFASIFVDSEVSRFALTAAVTADTELAHALSVLIALQGEGTRLVASAVLAAFCKCQSVEIRLQRKEQEFPGTSSVFSGVSIFGCEKLPDFGLKV